MNTRVLFSSASDRWETPREVCVRVSDGDYIIKVGEQFDVYDGEEFEKRFERIEAGQ